MGPPRRVTQGGGGVGLGAQLPASCLGFSEAQPLGGRGSALCTQALRGSTWTWLGAHQSLGGLVLEPAWPRGFTGSISSHQPLVFGAMAHRDEAFETILSQYTKITAAAASGSDS